MESYVGLIAMGLVLGALGTLIGAGGGFVLMPVLLLMYPHTSPETLTCISLAVVFFNALSGSWAYARMRRIDYKSGLLFAAAAVPGAVLGALSTAYIPRRIFDAVSGVMMITAAVYLFFQTTGQGKASLGKIKRNIAGDEVATSETAHQVSCNLRLGVELSLFVGYVSSLLGIGGGIIHVPILVRVLKFPVHIATATSHFILAIMALAGTIVHIVSGSFMHGGIHRTIGLSIGVLLGAQVGAMLSARVKGMLIIRGLAIALACVGLQVLLAIF